MAPWVFAAPAIAFALLPSVVGTAHASDGIVVTAAITWLTALAGVLVQPVARRLDTPAAAPRGSVIGLGVLAAGLVLGAVAAEIQHLWLLVPCAIVLGSAYGLCLVAGLLEVQRLAPARALAALTAMFYAFTYVGFAAPYLLSLAAGAASYPVLLAITAALALLSAGVVQWGGRRPAADVPTPVSVKRRPAGSHTPRVDDSPTPHLAAANRHERAATTHDQAAKFWKAQGDLARAALQRELAAYERHGAELERRWAKLISDQHAGDDQPR